MKTFVIGIQIWDKTSRIRNTAWWIYGVRYLGRPVWVAGLFSVENLMKGSAGLGKPVLVPAAVTIPKRSQH
jgi:hypothetical protein